MLNDDIVSEGFSMIKTRWEYVSDFMAQWQRFELWRAEPNNFLIYLLNHSDTMSWSIAM